MIVLTHLSDNARRSTEAVDPGPRTSCRRPDPADSESDQHLWIACYHRGGARVPGGARRATWPHKPRLLQSRRPVAHSRTPGRLSPKKVSNDTCSTVHTTAKVCSPAPAPHHQPHHDHPACVVAAGAWLAVVPLYGASAAAGWAQALVWCRLARPKAALWRFRSRARPRPLLGSAGVAPRFLR